MKTIAKNCAIYTRKSTDEGLDQDFNSLHAQREACEAYVTSQKAEGWRVVDILYDDGGYSGGNMERPALKALLDDIRAGKIRHKDQIHDGLHEAIIRQETWDAVQKKLQSHATTHRHHKKVRNENLLKGLLFDQEGIPYSPTHTKKDGKRYRYYINQTLLQYGEHPNGAIARLPAHETEQIVIHALRKNICKILHLDNIEDHVLISYINSSTALTDFLITESINRIIVAQHELSLDVNPETLRQLLKSHLDLAIPTKFQVPSYLLSMPFTIQRAYKGAVILKPDTPEHDPFDLPPHQLRNLVRGIVWRDEHFSGTSIKNIAAREQLSESGIRKIIMGSFDILR